jgi:hypothetical protein
MFFLLVLLAENKVQKQSANILQAVNLQESFTTMNTQITNKQSSMNSKFQNLQDITASLPFTINFQQDSSSTYSLLGVTGSQFVRKLFITIQFDVKINSLEGVLWYFFTSPSSLSKVCIFLNTPSYYDGLF